MSDRDDGIGLLRETHRHRLQVAIGIGRAGDPQTKELVASIEGIGTRSPNANEEDVMSGGNRFISAGDCYWIEDLESVVQCRDMAAKYFSQDHWGGILGHNRFVNASDRRDDFASEMQFQVLETGQPEFSGKPNY